MTTLSQPDPAPSRIASLASMIRQDPLLWTLTIATGLVHLAVAGRYDTFRNELYFIVCGRHPAFGYVDQPPLVPLIAALTQVFGDSTALLRLPAVAAAAALVPVTASLARLLGAGRSAALLAGVAAAIAPALVALTTIVTTETFEPLAWTGCAVLLAHAVVRADRRCLLWAGVVAGLGMEAKYGMALWLAALAIGVVATPARRVLVLPGFWRAALACALLSAPSLIWQTLEGWPFLEVIRQHADAGTNLTGGPIRFAVGQAVAMNLVLAPLWIAGILGPFVLTRLKPARFLSLGFIAAALLVFLLRGKAYYLYPAYPTLFGVGAAACAGLGTWLRRSWLVVAAANSALAVPIVLPVLSPDGLARYMAATHIKPRPIEAAGIGAPLTQVFSDELGWRELEKAVAAAYHALPPDEQARAAILATNYGEAAALDVYGPADGLPPAISGQNQYYLWGPRGHDGSVILHVNGDPERWRGSCESVEVVGTFGVPYAMPYERDRPIFICRGLGRNLTETWSRFKRYE